MTTQQDPDTGFELSLTEWCMQQSSVGHRVELLGAFHAELTARGITYGMAADFASLLEDLAARPA